MGNAAPDIGVGHGVTKQALKFLLDSTRETTEAVLAAEGGLTGPSEALIVAAETSRAAADMVESMMDRTARRRSLRTSGRCDS